MITGEKKISAGTPHEVIQQLSSRDLLSLARRIDDPEILRRIAHARFQTEATVMNDDPHAPFILWPAINKEPRQHWLPLILGKVARAEFADQFNGHKRIVVPVPASATWYMPTMRDNHLFNGAAYPLVLKDRQLEPMGISLDTPHTTVSVHSYVHNRELDGSRGVQDIHFFTPEIYAGADLVLVDDALANGTTAFELARFAKEELEVDRVFLSVPMAKAQQGGIELLSTSPHLDGLSILVTVTGTHGKGQPIDYHVNGAGA